ncbi:hypothetical protein HS7_01890 [Sulfolobales archaeon HS-7]|nr:hypothetical protein HS7_01890 [Sulfolobales archaeon HS-7]
MRLLYYLIRKLLTNPYVLGWSIAFTLFWVFMGAYVFSTDIAYLNPSVPLQYYHETVYYYTAGWTGSIVLFSLGSFCTTLTSILYYQTGALSHLFRYSKLTPVYYLSSIYAGSVISSVVIGGLLTAITYMIFSNKFGFNVYPKALMTLLLYIVLSSVFLVSFSMLLDIIVLRTSRKMAGLINFIPLILAYVFGYGYLFINFDNTVYFNPYTVIETLVISSYLGKPVPINYFAYYTATNVSTSSGLISLPLSILSLVVWTVVLTYISIVELRKLYYKPSQEGRFL